MATQYYLQRRDDGRYLFNVEDDPRGYGTLRVYITDDLDDAWLGRKTDAVCLRDEINEHAGSDDWTVCAAKHKPRKKGA